MTPDESSKPLNVESFRDEAQKILSSDRGISHAGVFKEILDALKPVQFAKLAELPSDKAVTQKHHRVITVQEVLRVARELKCGLCLNQAFVYVYDGKFWRLADRQSLEKFLGEAAQKLGVDMVTARDYDFKGKLLKQFLVDAYLPSPEVDTETVLINLANGTFEIKGNDFKLRGFKRSDFLTYQLKFDYDEDAGCDKWQAFLDKVLPDPSAQSVLAEYLGYVFAKGLKLEKALILYGTGANGKSVVFQVVMALLGKDNVTNFSLESLGKNYFRAMIGDKLLNYSSEISDRLQVEKFKQLTSGEPVEARLPYGQPMMLTNYARLMFNCNVLPRDVEHTNAFFRRFKIIPFEVTILESEQNPDLAKEIIDTELSGIFNWVLNGLKRLLEQKQFSPCESSDRILETFRCESDSVAMFVIDEHYKSSTDKTRTIKELYAEYKNYCLENNYRPLGRNKFAKRLEANGITRFDSYQPFFYIEKGDL